ncbi:MAG: sigma factor [Planctomycetota bacterium]
MPAPSATDRLSQIQTQWSAILQPDSLEVAGTVQSQLLMRYAGAVYRYLLVVAKNEDVASDLAQEFAYRFLRGDFRSADPSRGRFRDFVKRSVVNLAMDHFRRVKHRAQLESPESIEDSEMGAEEEWQKAFDRSWRQEVLERTWQRLESSQDQWTVLRSRARHADVNSMELSEHVSKQLGRDVSADWTRQTLSRARTKFAELLRIEVAESLGGADTETVDDELSRLGLLKYVAR